MNATKIVLADDHQVVRLGLRTLLESEPGFQVVGEAGDGLEAIRMAERFSPDVVILDLLMPRLNGIQAAQQIQARFPHIRIVILSMFDSEAYVVEALSAGASAYVLKGSTTEDLVAAVREVLAGKRYLSPSLSERAIDAYIRYVQSAKAGELDVVETLTPREREVLHLAAQGYTNAEIAKMLTLSSRTVETHRLHMMRKLGLHSQVDLARFALERGILPGKQQQNLIYPGKSESDVT
jgi:two-component system response regulator NreC